MMQILYRQVLRMLQKLSHPHLVSRMRVSILLLALVGGAWFGFIELLPEPQTWVALSATSEYIGYRVNKPDLSAFSVGRMRLLGAEVPEAGKCVNGLIEPQKDSYVEYRRGSNSNFEIVISPNALGAAATIFSGTDRPNLYKKAIVLALDETCTSGTTPSELPIFGQAVFGDYARPAAPRGIKPSWLLKGEVRVYALSQTNIAWMVFPRSIYLLREFSLPAGAVLCAGDRANRLNPPENCDAAGPGASAHSERDPYWVGIASPAAFDNGFDVAANSAASELLLSSAAAFGVSAAQEIDLGAHDQFIKDPNIVWIQFRFGILLFFIHASAALLAFVSKKGSY